MSDQKARCNADVGSITQGNKELFPPASTHCRLSYSVCTATMCNHMHQHRGTHLKSQTQAAIPLFGPLTILHTLLGMGSGALSLTQLSQPEYIHLVTYSAR